MVAKAAAPWCESPLIVLGEVTSSSAGITPRFQSKPARKARLESGTEPDRTDIYSIGICPSKKDDTAADLRSFGFSLKRIEPPQTGESGKVPIGRIHDCAVIFRVRRNQRVGRQIAAQARFIEQRKEAL